jgi:hypothetical protein
MTRQYAVYTLGLLTSIAAPALAVARQRRPVGPLLETVMMLVLPLLTFSYLTYRYWRLCQRLSAARERSGPGPCAKGDGT